MSANRTMYAPVAGPEGADITGRQPGTPRPDAEGDTRACPICKGAGEIPPDMDREEMIQAISNDIEGPEPPASETPFDTPGRMALDEEQRTEVGRLGARATNRMRGPRTFATG